MWRDRKRQDTPPTHPFLLSRASVVVTISRLIDSRNKTPFKIYADNRRQSTCVDNTITYPSLPPELILRIVSEVSRIFSLKTF